MSEHPLHKLAMEIRYDLTAAQGKLTELMRQVGEMPPPDAPRPAECRFCGLTFTGDLTLAEHLFNSHGGPVPAHWAAIEARSVEPEEVV